MISIAGKEFTSGGKIGFSPRQGFKRTHTALEFDLVYGHTCPVCDNVIQAVFKTPKPVSLWPYEQTRVLSQGDKNMGDLLKVIPDDKTPEGESCYRSNFYRSEDGQALQRIVLRNHIVRTIVIQDRAIDYNGDKVLEVGERCCPLIGVFSVREDLLMKDLFLLFKGSHAELEGYNLPKVQEMIPDRTGDPVKKMYIWTPAIGVAPPVILTERNNVIQGYNYYLKQLLEPFKKPSAVTTQ
jgi:hypothetical protein